MDQRTHYEKAETCLTLSEQADPESADRLLKAAQVHAHLAGDYKPPEEWSIDRAKIGQITLTDSGGEAHSTGAALQFPDEPMGLTENPCDHPNHAADTHDCAPFVDTAPDVDPDEALARVAHMAFWGGRMMPSPDSEAWLDVAHAVREHIEADVERLTRERDEAQDALGILVKRQTDDQSKIERLTRERDDVQDLVFGFRARIKAAEAERGAANVRYETQTRRAEKAEADLRDEVAEHDKTRATVLRLTREHDFQTARADDLGIRVQKAEAEVQRLTYLLGSHADGSQCTCTEINPGAEGISPPEWEQDPWCPTHPDMNVILTEVKRLRDGIDVIRSDARHSARIATVPGERRILRAIHLYLSGLLEPKPPTDFSTLLDETEGETDE